MGIDPKSLRAFATPSRKQAAPAVEVVEQRDTQPEQDFDDFTRYADLLPLLEEHHGEIIECCDELDSDSLTLLDEPMDDDTREAIEESFNSLDRKLQKVVRETCGEMPIEHAMKLADHLEAEGMIEDTDRFAGWLYRVGEWLAEDAA